MRIAVVFCFLTIIFPSVTLALQYPEGFDDLFSEKQRNIKIQIFGERGSIIVNALVTYDDFRITIGDELKVQGFLGSMNLKNEVVNNIVSDLLEGVETDSSCKGSIVDCIPNNSSHSVKYTFDYDNSFLKIFLGSNVFSVSGRNNSYYSALRQQNALINQMRIYTQAGSGLNNSLSTENDTTIGLPFGFIQVESQLNSHSKGDIYRAGYDYEFGAYRVFAGYTSTNEPFNTSDFLNQTANYASTGISYGTSGNLVRGGQANQLKLYFMALRAGQLDVYQDDRLLISRAVSSGQQFINYSELPNGSYDVRLVLKSGDQVLVDDTRRVVNTPDLSLPIRGVDYVLSVGQLDITSDHFNEMSSLNFGQFRSTYKWNENLLFASGLTFHDKDDIYTNVGAKYFFQESTSLDYVAGYFSTGDTYQSATLDFNFGLSLSVESLEKNTRSLALDLASQLYSPSSFLRYDIGTTTEIFNGTGYLSYRHSENKGTMEGNSDFNSSYTSNNLIAGWSKATSWGNIGLSLNYNMMDNSTPDNISTNIYLSYNFSRDLTAQLSTNFEKNGNERTETALTYSQSSDSLDYSTTVTGSVGTSDPETSLSAQLFKKEGYGHFNFYGYTGTNDIKMFSGSFTGTQIITADSVNFTDETGESFAILSPEIQGLENMTVDYDVISDNGSKSMGEFDAISEHIVSLQPYNEVTIQLNAEYQNLDISDPSRTQIMYPSTVLIVDSQINQYNSQIYVVSDNQGKPVTNLQCIGDDCRGVEALSNDGVFRVKFINKGTYQLSSSEGPCVFSQSKTNSYFISARCSS